MVFVHSIKQVTFLKEVSFTGRYNSYNIIFYGNSCQLIDYLNSAFDNGIILIEFTYKFMQKQRFHKFIEQF